MRHVPQSCEPQRTLARIQPRRAAVGSFRSSHCQYDLMHRGATSGGGGRWWRCCERRGRGCRSTRVCTDTRYCVRRSVYSDERQAIRARGERCCVHEIKWHGQQLVIGDRHDRRAAAACRRSGGGGSCGRGGAHSSSAREDGLRIEMRRLVLNGDATVVKHVVGSSDGRMHGHVSHSCICCIAGCEWRRRRCSSHIGCARSCCGGRRRRQRRAIANPSAPFNGGRTRSHVDSDALPGPAPRDHPALRILRHPSHHQGVRNRTGGRWLVPLLLLRCSTATARRATSLSTVAATASLWPIATPFLRSALLSPNAATGGIITRARRAALVIITLVVGAWATRA